LNQLHEVVPAVTGDVRPPSIGLAAHLMGKQTKGFANQT
jgi:hypothetical protein